MQSTKIDLKSECMNDSDQEISAVKDRGEGEKPKEFSIIGYEVFKPSETPKPKPS